MTNYQRFILQFMPQTDERNNEYARQEELIRNRWESRQNYKENAKLAREEATKARTAIKTAGGRKGYRENLSALTKSPAQAASSYGFAFSAVDPGKDAGHFLVIALSILADLLTLIPFIGSIFAFFFTAVFVALYWIIGNYKNSPEAKIITQVLCYMLEVLPVGIGVLPFFTTSAVVNYWIALARRKSAQQNAN